MRVRNLSPTADTVADTSAPATGRLWFEGSVTVTVRSAQPERQRSPSTNTGSEPSHASPAVMRVWPLAVTSSGQLESFAAATCAALAPHGGSSTIHVVLTQSRMSHCPADTATRL